MFRWHSVDVITFGMKLLHVSDTHFSLSTFGTDNQITGINSRALDGFQAFDQLVDYAIKNDIKLLVHSGDVFNTKSVSQNIIYAFYERIQKLLEHGIDVFILSGNHDIGRNKDVIKRSSLDLPNVLKTNKLYTTNGNEYLDLGYLQIVSFSYYNKLEEDIDIVNHLAKKVDFGRPAIMVGHCQVEFAQFPGSFKEDLPFIPLKTFTKHPFQAVLLGHIHKPQVLNKDPRVYYCGSLVACSFAEENYTHGFWELEIENNKLVSHSHVKVDCLKLKTFKGTMKEIRAQLEDTWPESFKNYIVRVIVKDSDDVIDESFLSEKFGLAFKHLVLKEKVQHDIVQLNVADAVDMNIRKLLGEYFEKEEDKSSILKYFDSEIQPAFEEKK